MTIPSRTELQIVQAVADRLAVRESGTATGGSTSALVCASYPFRTNRGNANSVEYANEEIYPTSGAEAGNARDISAWIPGAGAFTVGDNWATGPANADTFDIYKRGVKYSDIARAVRKALRDRRYVDFVPLTLVTDGDMESTAAGTWGTTSGCTFTKITAGTYWGERSGRVANSGANGYLPSTRIAVQEQDGYYLEASYRAVSGTPKLIAYDETNSTEIKSKSPDQASGDWGKIAFNFTIPNNCTSIVIRLSGVEASADIYWDNVGLVRQGATQIPLPDYITEAGQFYGLYRQVPGYERADMGQFIKWFWCDIVPDHGNPTQMFKVTAQPHFHQVPWAKVSRAYAETSGYTSTTKMPYRWLEIATTVNLLEMLKNRAPSREQQQWEKICDAQRRVLSVWDARLGPPPVFRHQFASPPTV